MVIGDPQMLKKSKNQFFSKYDGVSETSLRDTIFKKGDDEKNRRTKCALNSVKFQQAIGNGYVYKSFNSKF